jgi:hypothetical protein
MASFNIYNRLSETYWRPVDFSIVGDQFKSKKTPVFFDNGVYFYIHNILQNAIDFSFNRKTGTFLSNFYYNSYFLENNKNPDIYEPLKKIESPLRTNNEFTITIFNQNSSLPNNPTVLLETSEYILNSNNSLTFLFENNNKVIVKNKQGHVLTADFIGSNGLTFKEQEFPYIQEQLFDYFLGSSDIVLFKSGTNFTNIVTKGTNNVFVLSSVNFSFNQTIPQESVLYFTSYQEPNFQTSNSVYDSYIAKYKTTPITNQNKIEIDYEFSNNNLYSQNYLGLIPIENPIKSDIDCSYLLQIHGLKNYQTPEYQYTPSNPLFSESPSIRRIYNKIYTGTNQNKGYDRVYLGFEADTKEFDFFVNKENIFYFPPTSESTPISSSGLIEDGATAGEIPFTSDRLSVYRKNYEEIIPNTPQPKTITKYDRTWLCSWLSGSNLGDKIWLDRYYNAAYYTLDEALTAKAFVYNPKLSSNLPYTFDVPSSIVLEPGVLYNYTRVGKETSKNFIKYLDDDVNNPLGSKLLSITNWLSSPLLDDSKYKNNGLVLFNNPSNFKGNYWILDGNNHAVFPSKSSLLQNSKLTTSLWINVKDWGNIYGDQIFGNYYESGFGLINQGSLNAPLITITNAGSAVAYNLNYKFIKLSEIPLLYRELSALKSKYDFIQRLPDYSYWTFDTNFKQAVKYNPINNITNYFTFSSFNISNVDQIEIDRNQNFYFYDNTEKKYTIVNSNGNYISATTFPSNSGVNRIEINLNNEVVPIYGNASVIDNKNNIWEVVGSNLYKNRQIFANIGFTQQITCDSKNNIWLMYNQDSITKLNPNTGLFEFNFRIGKNSSRKLDPCKSNEIFRYMNFVKVPKSASSCEEDIVYEDNLIVLDTRDNEIYIIDEFGNLLSRLDIRALLSDPSISLEFYAKGDFTGYQFLRKFEGSNKNLAWKFKIAEPNGNNPQLFSLNYEVSSLPPGWHNFAFVFNTLEGYASYYIDSIKVDTVFFEPRKYQLYYDYRSSLLLGAATIKNTTLNDIIGIDNSNKFIGNISDLRMYSNSLTNGEIEQIYFSSEFSDPRKDLIWNTRVGDRNYIEEIEYWYKAQLPGSKSKYFNINIHNLNIEESVKEVLENAIRASINKIIPAESSLYKIKWM